MKDSFTKIIIYYCWKRITKKLCFKSTMDIPTLWHDAVAKRPSCPMLVSEKLIPAKFLLEINISTI